MAAGDARCIVMFGGERERGRGQEDGDAGVKTGGLTETDGRSIYLIRLSGKLSGKKKL